MAAFTLFYFMSKCWEDQVILAGERRGDTSVLNISICMSLRHARGAGRQVGRYTGLDPRGEILAKAEDAVFVGMCKVIRNEPLHKMHKRRHGQRKYINSVGGGREQNPPKASTLKGCIKGKVVLFHLTDIKKENFKMDCKMNESLGEKHYISEKTCLC